MLLLLLQLCGLEAVLLRVVDHAVVLAVHHGWVESSVVWLSLYLLIREEYVVWPAAALLAVLLS